MEKKIRIRAPKPLRGFKQYQALFGVVEVNKEFVKTWTYEVPESEVTEAIRLGGEIE
jgi:hypothetical protein